MLLVRGEPVATPLTHSSPTPKLIPVPPDSFSSNAAALLYRNVTKSVTYRALTFRDRTRLCASRAGQNRYLSTSRNNRRGGEAKAKRTLAYQRGCDPVRHQRDHLRRWSEQQQQQFLPSISVSPVRADHRGTTQLNLALGKSYCKDRRKLRWHRPGIVGSHVQISSTSRTPSPASRLPSLSWR